MAKGTSRATLAWVYVRALRVAPRITRRRDRALARTLPLDIPILRWVAGRR